MNDKIIPNLEQMLANGQDSAVLRFSLGNAYLQQKDYSKAIEHFSRCLAFEEDYSAAWKGYGKALAENQQISEAITAYGKGIAIAEKKGDKQAAKEMQVFLKRLEKQQ